jgi:hypothetical protein
MLQSGTTSLKIHIPITTFMIANDPYLQQFVNKFTPIRQSFYTGLKGPGDDFEDYETNQKRKLNKVVMHVCF